MGSFDRTAVDERSAPRYELPRRARRIAIVLAAWGFLYAGYRAYYTFGGQGAMIGQPVSQSQFRATNAVAVVILLVASVLPLFAVLTVSRPWVRRLFPVIGWAALALSLIGVGSRRRWWLSAVAGCLVLTAIGLLSGLGVIGSFRLG